MIGQYKPNFLYGLADHGLLEFFMRPPDLSCFGGRYRHTTQAGPAVAE